MKNSFIKFHALSHEQCEMRVNTQWRDWSTPEPITQTDGAGDGATDAAA